MTVKERISAFSRTGAKLHEMLHAFYDDDTHEFMQVLHKAQRQNAWFAIDEQKHALASVVEMLREDRLAGWMGNYPGFSSWSGKSHTIGVIMAGNIPLVGFHDLLCVLMSGNRLQAKCSSDDKVLVEYFCKLLVESAPEMAGRISLVDRISDIDAVIATGSNNSARYFEYYFGKYSHIIRKNRNGVAVLDGMETEDQLRLLGKDIFSFFGMGCRNVSKIFVPDGYDFMNFFPPLEAFSYVMQHNKYMNNFDYQSALLLMNQSKFLTNNFLIVREGKSYATPVSVLHYEFYDDKGKLALQLEKDKALIQCMVSGTNVPGAIPLGQSQHPGLMDYADGVDLMKFLLELG